MIIDKWVLHKHQVKEKIMGRLKDCIDDLMKDLTDACHGEGEYAKDEYYPNENPLGKNVVLTFVRNTTLDFNVLYNSDGEYLSCQLLITYGGPTIWIDTISHKITGSWGDQKYELDLDDNVVKQLDDAVMYEYGSKIYE